MKSIAIIGASADRKKFGNRAVRAYASKGYKVFPVNTKEKEIEGFKSYKFISDIKEKMDIASIYLPPDLGMNILEEIREMGVRKIYINPGAESEELVQKAKKLGLAPIMKCSILAIGIDPLIYDFS